MQKVSLKQHDNQNGQELTITNITYPYKRYSQFKHFYTYFAQSNVLMYGCEQSFKVWNVVGDQLIQNEDLEKIINKFTKLFRIKGNEIIIGIYENQFEIIHLSTQSIYQSFRLYQQLLYQQLKQELSLDLIVCQAKSQNVLCLGIHDHNQIQIWNIKQDKQKSQIYLQTKISALNQKKYIMIVQPLSSKYKLLLMIQNSNKYKRFRSYRVKSYETIKCHLLFDEQLYIKQHNMHMMIDITNMKIKQCIRLRQREYFQVARIKSLDFLIKLSNDKIMIYNKEYKLINETIIPYFKLNNSYPDNVHYNEKQGVIIFHDKKS